MFKTMPKQVQQSPEKKRLMEQTRGSDQYTAMRQMASLMGNQAMLGMMQSQGQYQKEQTPFFDDMRKKFGQKQKPESQASPTHQSSGGTSLPNYLREKIEKKSGLPMDDVRVHYNSDKPAELGALAYTQGTDVHIGPGQEEHLEHELVHVVQQKQGRVTQTTLSHGTPINKDRKFEREANGQEYKWEMEPISKSNNKIIQLCDSEDKDARPKGAQKTDFIYSELVRMYQIRRNDVDLKRIIRDAAHKAEFREKLQKYFIEELSYENDFDLRPIGTKKPIRSTLDLYYWLAHKQISMTTHTLKYADPLFLAAVLLWTNQTRKRPKAESILHNVRILQPMYDKLSEEGLSPNENLRKYYEGWDLHENSVTNGFTYNPPKGETLNIKDFAQQRDLLFLGFHYTETENALSIKREEHPHRNMIGKVNGAGNGAVT